MVKKHAQRMTAFFLTSVLLLSVASPMLAGTDSRAAKATDKIKVSNWGELTTALEDAVEKKETKITLSKTLEFDEGSKPIIIAKGKRISIDLAGYSIDRGLTKEEQEDNPDKASDGYVIKVESDARLTLGDSTQKPGSITGGANTGNGGGILCEDTAALTIDNGVKIKYNRGKNGGGIYLGKDCELYLGSADISYNDAISNGGGIYAGQSLITFLGGLTKIKMNRKDYGADNDLYLPADMQKLRFWNWADENKKKTVLSEEFEKGTRIGVLLQEMQKEISDGYGKANSLEASVYFFYNNDDYIISENTAETEIKIEKSPDKTHDNTQTLLETYVNGKLKNKQDYDSFAKAFEAGVKINADEVVLTMGDDYECSSEIVLEEKKKIVIDLNGHYIKRKTKKEHVCEKNGGVFHVNAGASLTIRDSHPKKVGYEGVKGGVITGGANSKGSGGITIEAGGYVLMEGGTIFDCRSDYNGGAVYLDTGSEDTCFEMTGGKIYNCRTVDSIDNCNGGGIYIGQGELKLKGATIEDCYTEDCGAAICCYGGKVSLNDMIFIGNFAKDRGGAIYIDLDLKKFKGTKLYAAKCDFVQNKAGKDGGAFCMRDNPENKGSITFDRCLFQENEAAGNGGAIVDIDDGLVISNTEIINNKAGGYGGGVFVDYRYDINVKGKVIIKDNTSSKDSSCADMALEGKAIGSAYVYSGGLLPGSWIGIGTTTGKSHMLSKKMPVYEMQYFHVNAGKIASKNVSSVEAEMILTASIFGVGKIVTIIIGIAALFIAFILLTIRKRKAKAQIKEGSHL